FLCQRLRHRPQPTLFPYTTLFRSAYHEWLMNKHGVVERNLTPWHTFALFIVLSLLSAFGFKASDPGFFQVVIVPYGVLVISYIADRKSTRLNSSHVSISYAVFCLK